MLQLRDYQTTVLDTLRAYLCDAGTQGAKAAFESRRPGPYRAVAGLEPTPYVCLRVPTGGGKTFLAAHAVRLAARDYLQAERIVVLWLAPSNAIVEQTLKALRDRRHPYRQTLDADFDGQVNVLDLKEALSITRADLAGATNIIVCTLQALRVDDTEGRKVYESAGALQQHFVPLPPTGDVGLARSESGQLIYSLANVLAMHRPVVMIDEAHNARTRLSFDTLVRVRPSCILEFTATPETKHDPPQGIFASNVLEQVSARQLKEADMVKLPIRLRTREQWHEVVADALEMRRELEETARAEEAQTGEYIRPIILFQAQSVDGDDISVEKLRQALIEDFQLPEQEIKRATGGRNELRAEHIDLFSPTCPVRYIITVKALVEGWDCSFAYVLCSVAEVSTPRSVEQVLGRILRLPGARQKRAESLNCAYAFTPAAADRFLLTARKLQDALIEGAGFQAAEAPDLVAPQQQTDFFGAGTLFAEATEPISAPPDLERLDVSLRNRVTYDCDAGTLTVRGVVTSYEHAALERAVTSAADREAVTRIYHRTQGRYIGPQATGREPLSVPLLAIREAGQLELFDEECLDLPWNIAQSDATLGESDFPSAEQVISASIDVTESGSLEMLEYTRALRRQMSLLAGEPGWTAVALANWIDRQFPHPDIPQSQSSLYVLRVVEALCQSRGITLDQLAQQKFRLAQALERRFAKRRQEQRQQAFQSLLFGPEPAVEVSPECCLTMEYRDYAPSEYFEEGYPFAKHNFHLIGAFDSYEEYQCAIELEQLPELELWVRNLARRATSFWLPTATDKFYPDFVARLTDGRILVVEYKSERDWTNDDSREKRAIGELWANRSGGRCLFVMPCGPQWSVLAAAVRT